MILFSKKLKNYKLNQGPAGLQAGMSYVELIVVLSIFAMLSSVSIFNYEEFQAKVDIKGLANDMTLKIVEAQKSALSGKLPSSIQPLTWKPSYGVYFDRATDDKSFVYFTDLDPANSAYDVSSCPNTGECIEKIFITKGNYISQIDSYIGASPTVIATPLSISFKRPNSSAVFKSNGAILSVDYIQITLKSQKASKAYIKIYRSGRIQIN